MIRNRKGQGMTEYVVIIAAVIAVFVLLWPKIETELNKKGTKIVADLQK